MVLGVDLGTSSSKAVLTTPDGAVVARAQRDHRVSLPRPGWAEVDAEAVWWSEVVSLCRELVGSAAGVGAPRVAAVAVSGVGPCLVVVDAAGRPLRPAVLYGIDTRAQSQIERLTLRYGPEALLARCGKALSSQAVGPKLAWVRDEEPELYARAARWHGSSSWVVEQLTGEHVQDHATASQCDPLYDLPARDWARDWAHEVAPGLPLPRLAWPAEVVGTVTAAAAAATGLAPGTPVVAGTVDAWAEAHSAGVRSPGDTMLMYGSTAFVLQVVDGLRSGPGVWATSGTDPGQYTLSGGTATAGALTEWVRDLTGRAPWPELLSEAAAVPPGAEGLLVLPHFAGERTPLYDPQARGVLAGLTLRHGRGHLVRAAYEGTALAIDQVLDAVSEVGGPPGRLVAVGGGTRSQLWLQVVSDVTGLVQHVPRETVGACYGGALLAATGAGLVPPGTDWSHPERTVEPVPANVERYRELTEVYADLQVASRDAVHRLATSG
ncbi:sugar kinase [Quadrisphaera sp. INWT6]|nr:sugar kinase [Quadrisphaera sp. INWT6]